MTEERSNPENDPLVTRAYRKAATETTPPALDDAVLLKARQAVSGSGWSRYAKTIYWLRPMAWAATIGLSLAIILELTTTPPVESELLMDTPAALPVEEVLAPRRDTRKLIMDDATPAPAEAAGAPRQDVQQPQKSKVTDAPAPIASEAEVKEELERLIRYREEAESRSADRPLAAEDAAAAQPSAAYAIAVPCGEQETRAPETWLECIERLDEQGRYVDAQRERERLAEAFPDFELPAPAN